MCAFKQGNAYSKLVIKLKTYNRFVDFFLKQKLEI